MPFTKRPFGCFGAWPRAAPPEQCLSMVEGRGVASALVFRALLPPHPVPPRGEGEPYAALSTIRSASTRSSAGCAVPSPCGRRCQSARRPCHCPTAQNVAMQVGHGFAGVRTVVDHQTIAGLFQSRLVGHLGGFEQEVPEHPLIIGNCVSESGNRFSRDD